MSPKRWKEIETIFHTALGLDASARTQFLESQDGDLRAEVETLLQAHESSGDFATRSAPEIAADVLASEQAKLFLSRAFGHYRVVEPIGHGGMGEVYLAEDTRSGRKAALKILPLRFSGDAERFQRFQQEARSVIALNHPNIVTIYEIGEEDSAHYIVSELVEGETLEERLRRGPVPLREAVEIALQVATALSAAHRAGIIHRDIKPANIMLRPDNYVKVLDFGIAKLAHEAEPVAGTNEQASSSVLHTNAGGVLGTARYMSPEQAGGRAVDPRTDVWSLGLVLYEMLAGAIPFTEATPADVRASLVKLTGVPFALQQVIAKALQKDRERRYSSMDEMLAELGKVRRKLDLPLVSRWRWAAAIVLAAVAMLLAAGLFNRAKPAKTSEAYNLYRQAREIVQRATTPSREDYNAAATLLEKAITLEPKSALTHAQLSYTYSLIAHFFEAAGPRREQALAEARESLRLQPDLGQGHQALAYCYYWGEENYAAAGEELRLAKAAMPNDAQNLILDGAIARHLGHCRQAIQSFDHALILEPANIEAAHLAEQTYTYVRDWTAALAANEKALAIVQKGAPDLLLSEKINGGYLRFYQTKDLETLEHLLGQTPTDFDPQGMVTAMRFDVALMERDFTAAERAIEQFKFDPVPGPVAVSKAELKGRLQRARGDDPAIVASTLDVPIRSYEVEALAHSEDPLRHALLGMAYSWIGRKEDAAREGRRAVELRSNDASAMAYNQIKAALAAIYSQTGAADEAIALLRELLASPGPVGEALVSITLPDLRYSWLWDRCAATRDFKI